MPLWEGQSLLLAKVPDRIGRIGIFGINSWNHGTDNDLAPIQNQSSNQRFLP